MDSSPNNDIIVNAGFDSTLRKQWTAGSLVGTPANEGHFML